MRWSGRPFLAVVVAVPIWKLWSENFQGMPADCRVLCRKEDSWSAILVDKERSGAWPVEMKLVCQRNHGTKWEGIATQEDKTALTEGVSLWILDKYSETLSICGGIYLDISHCQVQSRIKSFIYCKPALRNLKKPRQQAAQSMALSGLVKVGTIKGCDWLTPHQRLAWPWCKNKFPFSVWELEIHSAYLHQRDWGFSRLIGCFSQPKHM